MGKGRTPEVILKTDQRTVVLELGTGGKFSAKSSGWDENKVFLEGDHLDKRPLGADASTGRAPESPDPVEQQSSSGQVAIE